MKTKIINLFSLLLRREEKERKLVLEKLSDEFGLEPQGIDLLESAFDGNYYLQKYKDVRNSSYPPFLHFLRHGVSEKRNPCADFDMDYYITNNPDVINAGMHPYYHYLITGKHEKRIATRSLSLKSEFRRQSCPIYQAIERYFDVDFYLDTYPDIKEKNIDPIAHYIDYGAAEHRDPSRFFSTKYYLDDNEDVVTAKLNPFYHYVVAGQYERRFPKKPGGYKAQLIWEQNDIKATVESWGVKNPSSDQEILNLSDFIAKNSNVVFSYSHDNFVESTGGVQLCIGIEEKLYEDVSNYAYLHLSPFNPSPLLGDINREESFYYNVVVNTKAVGIISQANLVDFCRQFEGQVEFVLHALQGHSPRNIKDVINACLNVRDVKVWVHDSFLMCPSYTAQRNNVDFCHLPEVSSQACNICMYGEERVEHIERLTELFEIRHSIQVICPSQYTADLFKSRSPYKSVQVVVKNHLSLTNKVPCHLTTDEKPLKIAFVGFPVAHKGWNDFLELYYALKGDSRFDFLHIGSVQSGISELKFVESKPANTFSLNMVNDIKRNKVDVVFIPSQIPETFNFVTYESIAAGALIFCYENSGNISVAVKQHNQGMVFKSINEVQEELDRNLETIRAMERSFYDMKLSDFSFQEQVKI